MAPRAPHWAADWQLSCGEIKQRGAALLQAGHWTDCEFLVGASQDSFKAHKLILAMASPVFEAMFYGAVAEEDKPIVIPDMQPEDFKILLRYIYTDSIMINTFTSACGLYYGAQKYMLPHMLTACTAYLSCNLSPEDACRTYEFAQLYQEDELSEESVTMIKTKTKEVLTAPSFNEVRLSTVEMVFKLEPLSIDCELELFAAAERYAEAQDSKVVKPSTYLLVNDLEKADLTTECSIHNALEHIRFLTLMPRQFVEYSTLTSLLSESEMLALLMNICSRDAPMPMPEGFSTSREMRNKDDKTRTNATIVSVVNIRTLVNFYSPTVYAGNLPWRVNITHGRHRYLSVYPECNWEDKRPWSRRTQVEIRLLSRYNRPYDLKFNRLYGTESSGWGCNAFIAWEELVDPKNGFVKDECITVEVNIVVEPPEDDRSVNLARTLQS